MTKENDMAPKSANKAAKKDPSKEVEKMEKKSARTSSTGSTSPKDKGKIPIIEDAATAPSVDADELEEQEDAAAEASGQNSNAAALAAAAGGQTEMSASFKNFRHHPDMENFYRFIFENDLRHEALAIIDEIMLDKQQKRLAKGTKAQAH